MCKQSKADLEAKTETANTLIIIEIITAFIVTAFSIVARDQVMAQAARHDEKNLTPSDYTVFIRVGREQSDIFDSIFYDAGDKESSRG